MNGLVVVYPMHEAISVFRRASGSGKIPSNPKIIRLDVLLDSGMGSFL